MIVEIDGNKWHTIAEQPPATDWYMVRYASGHTASGLWLDSLQRWSEYTQAANQITHWAPIGSIKYTLSTPQESAGE